MTMTKAAQAVYAELNSRRGVIDGIDDDTTAEMCEAVAESVINSPFQSPFTLRVLSDTDWHVHGCTEPHEVASPCVIVLAGMKRQPYMTCPFLEGA